MRQPTHAAHKASRQHLQVAFSVACYAPLLCTHAMHPCCAPLLCTLAMQPQAQLTLGRLVAVRCRQVVHVLWAGHHVRVHLQKW